MISFWSWTLAAVIALAFSPLAMKMALSVGGAPLPVALITTLFAALLVCGWLLVRNKARRLPRLGWRQRMALLVVGALSAGLVPLFGILAMTETSASNRALFQSAYPAATALAARFLLGERLGPFSYVLIALVCTGLVLMNVEPAPGLSMLHWPFWLLLATLPMIGLADVIAKKSLVDQPPEVVAAGRAVGGVLVLTLTLPWAFPGLAATLVTGWHWLLVGGLCMGIFAVALYQVFDRTKASLAASLVALAPVLTLAAEAALLGVALSAWQWAGFTLVLIALLWLGRRI
jgi:drug/metabolite transporter (DMT)-like permease